MSQEAEQNQLAVEAPEFRKQFKVFALSCLAFWIVFLGIETAAGGYVSGTNELTYLIVNATKEFLPWPAVILGCISSNLLVRIPLGLLSAILGFGLVYRNKLRQLIQLQRGDVAVRIALDEKARPTYCDSKIPIQFRGSRPHP